MKDETISNNLNNPKLQSLQRQKSELKEQISHLENMRNNCNRQIKGEADLDKISQLNGKMENYSLIVD